MLSTPIWVPIVLIKDNLEKGSTIKFDMDSKGKNCVIESAILFSGKILKTKRPFAIASAMFQTKRNPRANAERFTNIPKNKQKEKKPTSLTKKAKRYSMFENTMPISV